MAAEVIDGLYFMLGGARGYSVVYAVGYRCVVDHRAHSHRAIARDVGYPSVRILCQIPCGAESSLFAGYAVEGYLVLIAADTLIREWPNGHEERFALCEGYRFGKLEGGLYVFGGIALELACF